MNSQTPLVTVLMPVYNGSKYLGEAIESILNQTFNDFEFLIIDDKSKDNSVEIIRSYNDQRIRLIQNNENIGQSLTLNRGIRLSTGRYVARLDQDDISLPNRLKAQFEYMEKKPWIGLLCCQVWDVDENRKFISTKKKPVSHHQNMWKLLYHCSLYHPTVFIRKCVLSNIKPYDKNYAPCADYELWSRLIYRVKVEQINEVLVHRRIHDEMGSIKRKQKGTRKSYIISKRAIKRTFFISDFFDLFFDQYVHIKVSGRKSSKIKKFLGAFQAIWLYYFFFFRFNVNCNDREWIKNDLLIKLYPNLIREMVGFLLR